MTEPMDVQTLWSEACTLLKKKSETFYEQWFSKMIPLSFDGSVCRLGVPDEFFGDWIRENSNDLLIEALSRAAGVPVVSVEMEIRCDQQGINHRHEEPEIPGEANEEEEENRKIRFSASAPSGAGSASNPDASHSEAHDAAAASANAPKCAENCLARHSFANFVVGEGNRVAYTVATSVAKEPGSYNPLYIYGGPGLGKTHLIQAVANDVIRRNPSARIRYTTCEAFLNAYVDSLRSKTNYEFREHFRNVDFLLIDDVHILSGKAQLQEEFFNTFNTLHNANKQIILTSDKPPAEIPGLESRLVSRFESGITTQITPPSFETRLAILKQEAENQPVKLDDNILEFIASRITSNVRPLKSALLHLEIFAEALQEQITIETVENLLADLFNKEAETRNISMESIIKAVAAYFEIPQHDIIGPKRPKNIADARMIAMYLCRKLTSRSQKEIGQTFGGRNHATVIHAVKAIEDACVKDESMKRNISTLQRQLQSTRGTTE